MVKHLTRIYFVYDLSIIKHKHFKIMTTSMEINSKIDAINRDIQKWMERLDVYISDENANKIKLAENTLNDLYTARTRFIEKRQAQS